MPDEILGMTLTEVRTVHSRARTAWKTLSGNRDRLNKTPAEFLRKKHEVWDRLVANNPRLVRPTDDALMADYRRWEQGDEDAWNKLDQVVRLLDEYARPNKRAYPKEKTP